VLGLRALVFRDSDVDRAVVSARAGESRALVLYASNALMRSSCGRASEVAGLVYALRMANHGLSIPADAAGFLLFAGAAGEVQCPSDGVNQRSKGCWCGRRGLSAMPRSAGRAVASIGARFSCASDAGCAASVASAAAASGGFAGGGIPIAVGGCDGGRVLLKCVVTKRS